jgi:predicted ribosome quality control (RQC) complex YloA/Tae2 family protein
MKLSHLRQIVDFMQPLRNINAIYRVADTVIKIVFDKEETLYFDMHKGNSAIYMTQTPLQRSKVYQAPFDVMLSKRLNRAKVTGISLLNDDKIIRIETAMSSAYKESVAVLQLEFTGKTTNAIILDENDVVLEALRHVDAMSSYRIVRVGYELLPPPPPPYKAKEFPLDDVRTFLHDTYREQLRTRLEMLKKQKVSVLQKKLSKLLKRLDAMDDEESLEAEMAQMQMCGNLVLANMYRIKPYMEQIELHDFEGNEITLHIPPNLPSASAVGDHFFTRAKKAKQRAANLHIERRSLEEKCEHLRHFIRIVEEAKELGTIRMLFPAQVKESKTKTSDSVETFWVEGYKVMLGKSEKGNIELLENARARDIWLHMKDRPSAHVIIVTDKQNVPENVLEAAARLCVDFTGLQKGRYLVDYTPRREVKIQEGANVLYNKYKTLQIEKE